MKNPTLYIFSGLPGSGKSTLAQELAKHLGIAYLRVDTVEQALRDLCDFNVEGEGYRLSYRIVNDNLKLGISCIADSCNPIQLTRDEWNNVAKSIDVDFVNIEIRCSNLEEHKHRVETRDNTVAGMIQPTWEQVEQREYDNWVSDRLVIDTANKSISESTQELIEGLKNRY